MSSFQIRRARPEDMSALAEIQRSSMEEIASAAYEEGQISAFLRHGEAVLSEMIEKAHLWVAMHDDRIVGCAGWCRPGAIRLSGLPRNEGRQEAEIRCVHVRPDWIRRGVACQLMSHIGSELSMRKIERVSLLSTLGGVAFYRALGFRALFQEELMIDGVGVPGIAMFKSLLSAEEIK